MNNASAKIALGCDHAAYQLKEQIKTHLLAKGLEVKDFGTFDETSVDYPDYAFFVGKAVTSGECSRGIVLDKGTKVFDGPIDDATAYYEANY